MLGHVAAMPVLNVAVAESSKLDMKFTSTRVIFDFRAGRRDAFGLNYESKQQRYLDGMCAKTSVCRSPAGLVHKMPKVYVNLRIRCFKHIFCGAHYAYIYQ